MTTYSYSTSTASAVGFTHVTYTYQGWNRVTPRRPPDDGLAGACAVLGIPPGTPPDGIRKAYRAKVKEVHPDHGGDASMFRRVQNAYERLIRP